ncbi:hypothetical protein C1H46_040868 [Malus baccata]|uniref:Uncharacterized protein n=1 Tax=Malus baccata TaxID=106549 RepID=A0A540KHB0_MALBA|nr:hypothetical protein C1H46_040868 [Malus baccata]
MSNLISNRRVASRVGQTSSSAGSATATSPPDMGTTSVPPVTPISPMVYAVPASSTFLVTHHVLSGRRTHRQPRSYQEVEQFVVKIKGHVILWKGFGYRAVGEEGFGWDIGLMRR